VGGLANSNILKLNLVVVNGARTLLDATTAQSDPEVQGALSQMDSLYSTVGITVQVDGYYDFSDSTFATISTEAELEQLFTHSGDIPNDYLTIFLINGFGAPLDPSGNVAGIAGGIPVPNKLRGTLHSGVAVALQTGNGVITGEDMAHEAGHSLGLYHTTEFDDQTHDPISDTPQCSTASSNPGACPDYSDVMFPQLSGAMTGFSTGQGIVIRPALAMESGASFAPSTATAPDIHDAAHAEAQSSGLVITCRMQRQPLVPSAPLTVVE